jgi:hypothetical protein
MMGLLKRAWGFLYGKQYIQQYGQGKACDVAGLAGAGFWYLGTEEAERRGKSVRLGVWSKEAG